MPEYTKAQKQIRADEGEVKNENGFWQSVNDKDKHKVYKDTEGKYTVGNGHLLTNPELKKLKETQVGLTPEGMEITQEEADEWFAADLKDANDDVEALYGDIPMAEEQREVLVNMAFNLGRKGLRKFKQMRKGLVAGDSKKVAHEMQFTWDKKNNKYKTSDWYEQVKGRGKRLVGQVSKIPSTGKFDPKLDDGRYD